MEVEGRCPHRLVGERRQNHRPLHRVHYHPPELLQQPLQDRLLTHSGKEREAAGPGRRSGQAERLRARSLSSSSDCPACFIPTGQPWVLYSLAVQEVHERPEHTVCILGHRGPCVWGCVPWATYLAQDVSHLSNALIDPHLETTHAPTVQPSSTPAHTGPQAAPAARSRSGTHTVRLRQHRPAGRGEGAQGCGWVEASGAGAPGLARHHAWL